MYKKLAIALVAATGLLGLKAVDPKPTIGQKIAGAAWKLVKPFDIIGSDKVTYFTPHGREYKTMDEMKKEISEGLPTITDKSYPWYNFSHHSVIYTLDNDYNPNPDGTNKKLAAFNEVRKDHEAAIADGKKTRFSIHTNFPTDNPEKNKDIINIWWYAPGCEIKRFVLRKLHYTPYTYGATVLKWAALVGLTVEIGKKVVNHIKKKAKQESHGEKSEPVEILHIEKV